MKTVVSYLQSVPNRKNREKVDLLVKFVEGVKSTGDNGILWDKPKWIPSDVGVLQGFVHEDSPNRGHLKLRKTVFDKQVGSGKKALVADSNLFLYAEPTNAMHYLRYSFNGIFPTDANYFWDDPDPARWNSISKNLNLSLKDWRSNGDHILICLQRNGGWSMKGLDVMQWCNQTIKTISTYSDRPIVVRAHPGDKKARDYLKLNHPNVRVSFTPSILDDLKNAWATVTYNSSPGVASAIEGVPVYVMDPEPKHSQAVDIANISLANLENPNMPDRQKWIEKISMSHWNFDELSNGEAWNHIKNFI